MGTIAPSDMLHVPKNNLQFASLFFRSSETERFFVPHQTYIAHVNTCIFSFLIEPVLMNSRGKYLLISVYAITIEILN